MRRLNKGMKNKILKFGIWNPLKMAARSDLIFIKFSYRDLIPSL